MLDDALGVLAAGEPGPQDDGVFDDDLVVAREVLHPPAQGVEPGIGVVSYSVMARLPDWAPISLTMPPRQQAVQFASHVTDRRRPVEVADRQLGAHLDLARGELLVVGGQHTQHEVGGHRQAVAGACGAHGCLFLAGEVGQRHVRTDGMELHAHPHADPPARRAPHRRCW